MSTERMLLCIGLMALVTYILRVLPVTLFRRSIQSEFIRDFLDYIPYTVLGAITFPGIFYATGDMVSAVAGTVVSIGLACLKQNLIVVALGAICTVYLL